MYNELNEKKTDINKTSVKQLFEIQEELDKMSLLTRQGTMVRKNRNSIKRSIRRKPNSIKKETSGPPASAQPAVSGVKSTVAGVHGEYRASPARSVASTVVVSSIPDCI